MRSSSFSMCSAKSSIPFNMLPFPLARDLISSCRSFIVFLLHGVAKMDFRFSEVSCKKSEGLHAIPSRILSFSRLASRLSGFCFRLKTACPPTESNCQPSNYKSDALSIELEGLKNVGEGLSSASPCILKGLLLLYNRWGRLRFLNKSFKIYLKLFGFLSTLRYSQCSGLSSIYRNRINKF